MPKGINHLIRGNFNKEDIEQRRALGADLFRFIQVYHGPKVIDDLLTCLDKKNKLIQN